LRGCAPVKYAPLVFCEEFNGGKGCELKEGMMASYRDDETILHLNFINDTHELDKREIKIYLDAYNELGSNP